jgi:hypothetical protein
MTEAEWDACADPTPMLAFLRDSGRLSERKARLFAVACARTVWPWMLDQRSRQAVEVGERYADGLEGQKALKAVRREAFAATKSSSPTSTSHAAVVALDVCMNARRHDPMQLAVGTAGCANSLVFHVLGDAAGWAGRKAQCGLLRDTFGNPCRPVVLDPAWLAWNGGAVRKMAQAIYADHRFADLPILADALEEAGCADAALLGHCRGPGEHVRGCWVVDLLLGKG